MVDLLETAASYSTTITVPAAAGLQSSQHIRDPFAPGVSRDFNAMVEQWVPLTLLANSLNRSLGHGDAYPFATSAGALRKLQFVHEVQPLAHAGRDELVDLAVQRGDLAHEGAADELVAVAGREEDRLHLGHQRAVHARELELVVEVGDRAQATHHGLAAARDHEVAQQAAKAFHLDVGIDGYGLAHHLHALFEVEQGLLVVARRHGHDHMAEELGGAAHHVLVAQGDRIEGSGIDGNHIVAHGGRLPWLRVPGPGTGKRIMHCTAAWAVALAAVQMAAQGWGLRSRCAWTAPAFRWRYNCRPPASASCSSPQAWGASR
ncbi:hypothetical protein FQR65_LT20932 [Abscondita terminalis]|nr:hypothetical protein FQR65_LT20932 [Abscondita terminalis]